MCLITADFSWFTDGPYLKGESGKYYAVYAITAPFDVVVAVSLTMDISVQKNKTYDFTWTCTLAKGGKKTVNIYTDSKHVLGVAHNSEMLW